MNSLTQNMLENDQHYENMVDRLQQLLYTYKEWHNIINDPQSSDLAQHLRTLVYNQMEVIKAFQSPHEDWQRKFAETITAKQEDKQTPRYTGIIERIYKNMKRNETDTTNTEE